MEKSTLRTMKFGREKLKNIWYFYKKQIIAGILILAVLVFLLVQCVSSKKYDFEIYYAGNVYLTSGAQKEVCKAFEAVLGKEYAESFGMITTVVGADVVVRGTDEEQKQGAMDYTGQKQTLETFKSHMRLPNTVICILSPDCFATASSDEGTLRPLSEIFDTLPDGATDNGLGIALSSLPFYESNTILKTFDGCILCVKSETILQDDEEKYARQIEIFQAIVNYAPVH